MNDEYARDISQKVRSVLDSKKGQGKFIGSYAPYGYLRDPKDKYKYKLHYIYREFTLDFFSMDLNQLPSWVTSFKFRKNNAHIMGLCLTYHVNLGLSLRKTAEAMQEIHNIGISHTMVASYARTAAVLIKPFVDSYDYDPSNDLSADETYIKIKGIKG